jgi:hypothetical protein
MMLLRICGPWRIAVASWAPGEHFVGLFRAIDPERTRTMTLEETVDGPMNMK